MANARAVSRPSDPASVWQFCEQHGTVLCSVDYDLVALAIGATPSGTKIAESRELRAARLHKIKHDVGANLRDCELNIASVAARHGITPRYVHKLFESEGVTFAEYLRSERLTLAYRMLTDARLADLSVSSLAYEAGFNDLSNFNHLFRRRYSATPSDVRKGNYPGR